MTRSSPSNDPLGNDNIDEPAGSHQRRPAQFTGLASEHNIGNVSQHLSARAHPNRIAANHPRPVCCEVAASDGIDGQDDCHRHRRSEHDAKDVEQLAVAFGPRVEMSHPQTR
jgi:hypothetical protein